MSYNFYKILFKLFEYLSDITKGFPLFAKYKILLGTIIISITISCNNKKPESIKIKKEIKNINDSSLISCYEIVEDSVNINNTEEEIKKYRPAIFKIDEDEAIEVEIFEPLKLVEVEEVYEEPVYCYVRIESVPLFHGGDISEFERWVQSQINYKKWKIRRKKGVVVVEFTVLKTGKLDSINIIKSLNPATDSEVLRILSSSPRWIAATEGTRHINTKCTLAINFDKKLYKKNKRK